MIMTRKEYNTEISKLKRRISALVADIDEINTQRSEIGNSELKNKLYLRIDNQAKRVIRYSLRPCLRCFQPQRG